jgi:hypothetical protein
MTPLLAAVERQAEHFAIELLGPRQVIDVEAGFEDVVDVH